MGGCGIADPNPTDRRGRQSHIFGCHEDPREKFSSVEIQSDIISIFPPKILFFAPVATVKFNKSNFLPRFFVYTSVFNTAILRRRCRAITITDKLENAV